MTRSRSDRPSVPKCLWACALLLLAAAGVTQLELVTVAHDGGPTDGLSRHFSLVKRGRLISFMSEATNLVADDTNGVRDVFVRDLHTGVTRRVSLSSAGEQADGPSNSGPLSRSGRRVAFHSEAANLVPGDTNGVNDVFVHDLKSGETRRVSVASDGAEADAGGAWPGLARRGRVVAFRSSATNLVPGDTNGAGDVFLHDLKAGVTTRVGMAWDGSEPDGPALRHALSENGRQLAVLSAAGNLVPGDTNGKADVFLFDLKKGTVRMLSVAHDGGPSDGDSGQPSISDNGRFVSFTSWAGNLVPGDTNATADVFVWDSRKQRLELCSLTSQGAQADGECVLANTARNGRIVFFDSYAGNLVPDDTNGARDVFMHDRKTGETRRLSERPDGVEGNADSFRPRSDRRGRLVAIFSGADNLAPGDGNGVADVFVVRP